MKIGHYINEEFQLCSGLIGLVSCGVEHHTGAYVKDKTEQDLEDRWVTNLNEDRKRFFLIASLRNPHTKSLSFCSERTN